MNIFKKFLSPTIALLIFIVFSVLSVHLMLKPGSLLFGEYVESINFKSFWVNILYPWNNYFSLGHTNLGFPHSSSYVAGQVFGTYFASGHIYWLTLTTTLQSVFGPYASVAYVFLSVLLPFLGMYSLAAWLSRNYVNHSRLYPLLASLIYGVSPQVVLRIQVGSLRYSFAYALLPLVILFYYKYMQEPLIKTLVCGSLLFTLMFYIQPHFVLLYGFFALISLLSVLNNPLKIFRFIFIHAMWGLVLVIATLHIWLPPMLYKEPNLIPENDFFTGANVANGLGSKVASLAALTAGHGPNYQDFFYPLKNPAALYAVIFICISIWGAVLMKKYTQYRSFIILLLVGVTFGSATQFPIFGPLLGWLYVHLSFLHAFRDTTKFMSLIITGYALLIPIVLIKKSRLNTIALVVVIFLVANFSKSFFSGDFDHTATIFNLPGDYQESVSSIPGRVLYLAPKKSIEGAQDYSWNPETKNPSLMVSPYDSLIPLPNGSLSMAGAIGETYSTRVLAYLENLCGKNYFPDLLQKTGTNWVVYDTSIAKDIVPTSQLCSVRPIMPKDHTLGDLEIYRAPDTGLIEQTTNPLLIFGNLSIYPYLGENYPKLLKNSLIFLEQNRDLALDKILSLSSNIIVYNTSLTEASLVFANKYLTKLDFSQVLANPSNSKSYWVWDKGTVNELTADTGDFVLSKLPVYTTGKANLSSSFTVPQDSSYIIMVHILTGPDKGSVNFDLDSNTSKTVTTDSSYSGLVWQSIFLENLKAGQHTLNISTTGNTKELIDQVGFINSNIFSDAQKSLQNYLISKPVAVFYTKEFSEVLPDWDKLEPTRPTNLSDNKNSLVSFQQESPVHITVRPTASQVGLVVFKESYSPFWELDGKAPIIVDGFSNGFIMNDSTYSNLEYIPTNFYQHSLFISSSFIGLLLILLLIPTLKPPRQQTSEQ